MSASMSIRVIPCGFLSHRAAAFLRQLRQGVILGEDANEQTLWALYKADKTNYQKR